MSTNDTSTAGWSDSQAATFAKAAIERAGGKKAWHGYLSQPQREGAIAQEFAMVLIGNERETLPAKAISGLYRAMRKHAGLTD